MSVLVVTGTGTGVGKTVGTAALAVRQTTRGGVLVVKPTQTGTVDGDSDAAEVARLAGCATQEWTTLPEPLSPEAAARRWRPVHCGPTSSVPPRRSQGCPRRATAVPSRTGTRPVRTSTGHRRMTQP